VGGASRIAASIIPVIESGGGRVLINAAVEEIEVEGNRAVGVRMAEDGRLLRAPTVVSDAGVRNTFGRLVPEAVRRRHGLGRLLEQVRPSHAYLCLYVGLLGSAEELGMETPNLWIYPDERHEENLRNHLEDRSAPFPLVYVSFPAAKDPDFARRHPGRSTVDLITLTRHDWFAEWAGSNWKKRGEEYEALKEELAQRLLDVLYEQLPQLRGKVETWELSTPLTAAHFASHPTGEPYGIEHSPRRFRQRWLRPRTPVKGLWLTGQDVASCGVAGALFGAVLTASALEGAGLMRRVMKDVRERRAAAASA
jgi:all-trans-retinol 13,14-reductase